MRPATRTLDGPPLTVDLMPEDRREAYSFELSGGQRQRAMIAMALSTEPRLLIADEPTTALDVTTQLVVLRLLKRLQAERGMAMLFITHDMSVVANIAGRVAVMHKGRVVESGPVRQVLRSPKADYTRALIAAVPDGRPDQFRAAGRGQPVGPPILSTRALSHRFRRSRGLFSRAAVTRAVEDVSLDLRSGETLAVVGESGSGKTTLGRAIIGLIRPTAGARVPYPRRHRARALAGRADGLSGPDVEPEQPHDRL